MNREVNEILDVEANIDAILEAENVFPSSSPTIRRYIRDMENPFERFCEVQFRKRYRFFKAEVQHVILPKIQRQLMKPSRRGLPVAPEIQLLVSLRFYATGSFQAVLGDVRGLNQSTICRIVKKVSILLANELRNYTNLPKSDAERERIVNQFYSVGGFPGVFGVIDCTHIRIQNPGGASGEVYRNRKGWFSFNVQVTGGPNGEIMDVVVRWPGREHDSTIFNFSTLKTLCETRTFGDSYLLGDSGYPCLPYLMTPVMNPQNEGEERYNRAHIRTRNTIECLFGRWKRRFPCLWRGMANKLENVVAIVCACATLFNMTLGVAEEEEAPFPAEQNAGLENPHSQVGVGVAVRRALIERHFR